MATFRRGGLIKCVSPRDAYHGTDPKVSKDLLSTKKQYLIKEVLYEEGRGVRITLEGIPNADFSTIGFVVLKDNHLKEKTDTITT